MSDLHPFAVARTQAEAAEVEELVNDLREYLSDREDADHNGERFIPNEEMRLLIRLNELFPALP
jgi:hypothetical protein